MAAWAKPDRNGKTFFAGNAKVKGQKPVGRTQREAPMGDDDIPDRDLSDNIPF